MKRIVFNNRNDLIFDLKGCEKLERFLWDSFGGYGNFIELMHGAPHWLSVYDNALKLCDLEAEKLLPEQRVITLIAAYLHDVGRLINYDNHSVCSAEFIKGNLSKADLNLSERQIDWIALLARGHYLANDTPSFKSILLQRVKDNRMDICLKIVRDADALDRIRFNGLDKRFLRLKSSESLEGYVTEKWNGGYSVVDVV